MPLEGLHHITAMTADAPTNVDFYTRVLGLRLVKKTVNQDQPNVYHLFYGDEAGSPGCDLTFFEFRGLPQGRAGDGMVHRIIWRVADETALSFWRQRLGDEGVPWLDEGQSVVFKDPEGLEHQLLAAPEITDVPLAAQHPQIPARLALQGFHGVRAYAASPQRSQRLFSSLGMQEIPGGWSARGAQRGAVYLQDPPPDHRARRGAGTVHHVAWSIGMGEEEIWRTAVESGGGRPTPVIDRFWFHSIYFPEPSGVLFELATRGPGFTADEPLESLGESLVLPPFLEPYRAEIEPQLTPLPPSSRLRAPTGTH